MHMHDFNARLLKFIAASPTPFHAVASMCERLLAAGFEQLDEANAWQLQPGHRYLVTRNDSSLIAFTLPQASVLAAAPLAVRLAGTHTDSPCLRIKPLPDLRRNNYLQVGVEVYGGALLNPWFDRDLSIAGRVDYLCADNSLRSALVDMRRPVAIIPSLAIHLDREANQSRSVNAQKDLPPVLSIAGVRDASFDDLLLAHLHDTGTAPEATRVLSHELSFYDTQAPAIIGLHHEFIASARLDNLLSCHVGLEALLHAGADTCNMLVCSDHEEVGSTSASGAQGPFLRSVLERIIASVQGDAHSRAEDLERTVRSSMLLSIDNAHGVHPNFMDKHDGNHGPVLNQGPVIKINANQRYASNSRSVSFFKSLCLQAEVPVQSFVVRSDMACGSTIGPITAAGLGIETVDIGVPTFAMHSIRELAGSEDAYSLCKAVRIFFNRAPVRA